MTEIALPPQFGPSREWIIDQRVKELIGALVTNNGFTKKERQEFDALNDERVRLMMPASFQHRRSMSSRFGFRRRASF